MRLGAYAGGLTIAGALGILSAWAASDAPNAETGAAISAQCAVCHGSNGISVGTSIPNLAGQHYVYLLNSLEAFKTGARNSPIMHEMVASLSQQQIQDLAAYYASIPIQVGVSEARK